MELWKKSDFVQHKIGGDVQLGYSIQSIHVVDLRELVIVYDL